jgi:hypothetical protein
MNEMEVSEEFIEAVSQMRETQKEFFKGRNASVMLKAKNLERDVDNMLYNLPKSTPAAPKPVGEQTSIFGQT